MEKVLDINDLIGERGFLPSSSDDEEEAAQISQVKATMSSRLANIFGEDASSSSSSVSTNVSSETKKSPSPQPATIFSSVVDLYLPESSSTSISKAATGRVGMAVVRSSGKSDLLIFYNANKETILLVPLGPGSISEIKKTEKFLVIASSSRRFALQFTSSDDEHKLIAVLMILCSIDSVDIEAGSDDEVHNGSVIRYEATSFIFDGTIKACNEEQSKMRVSASGELWVMRLLGMRKSAKRMVRKDENSVFLVHVRKIKSSTKKQDNSISASTAPMQGQPAADESNDVEVENDLSKEQQPDHEDLRRRMASIGLSILPTDSLPMSEDFPSRSGAYSPQPDISENVEPSSKVSTSREQGEASPEGSAATLRGEELKKEQEQPRLVRTNASVGPLDNFLALQRIIGTEIDRLEIRLEAALERMVDRHMNTLREEMRQLKERQELLLKKIEGLQN
ncbi:hypothetical protein ANCCAN_00613 [Ancylostoma caninum]|uniref:Uncharacterized protein n=1 Tax=Ancylostoma caninum TaxID=29170 RepID=A0A368H912_ANCCA|nr:hypothetical protein ANCCAN_00613 [Ancylostoma caninum]